MNKDLKNSGSKVHHGSFAYQSGHTFAIKGFILLISFGSGILIARALGPAGKGALAFFYAFLMMLVPLGEMGIRQSTAYLIGKKHFDEGDVYSNMKGLYLIMAGVWTIILSIIFYYMDVFNKYGFKIPIIFLAILPFLLIQNYYKGILIGKKQIEKINYSFLLNKGSNFILLVIFLYLFKFGLLGAGVSALIAQILSAAIIIHWVHKYISGRPKLTQQIYSIMLKKGVLFAVALFIIILNYRIDIIMLDHFQTRQSVGIYSVSVNICELLKELPLTIGLVLFSRSANWNGSDLKNSLEKTAFLSRVVFFAMIVLSIIVAFASRYLIPALYGPAFADSVSAIWILLPGIVVLSVFLVLNFFAAGQGLPQLSIKAFLPAFILNILLNLYFIPRFDFRGAALSSTISYSAATVYYSLLIKRKYKLGLSSMFLIKKDDIFHLTNKVLFKGRKN